MARDVLIRFRIQDDGTVALERIGRAADGTEKQLEQAGRAGTEAGQKIRSGANAAESGIGGLVTKMGALVGALGGLYAIRQGFEAIIGTAARFESLGASFRTAMGSVAGGQQAMAWVTQFTRDTPFQLEQVASGFLRLRNAGIDPTSGSLRALGDAVSAYAGGSEEAFGRVVTAVGQIGAKGKLSGEELMQLAEANIPVYQILQEKLGLTGEQVGNIGKEGIDAATGLNALFEGLNERVGGAMAAQMTTLGGLWSNFRDQVSLALVELANYGMMDAAKDALARLSTTIEGLSRDGTLAELGRALGQTVQGLATLADAVGPVARAFTFGFQVIELAWVALQTAIATAIGVILGHFADILERTSRVAGILPDFMGGAQMRATLATSAAALRGWGRTAEDVAKGSADRFAELWEKLVDTEEATGDLDTGMGLLAPKITTVTGATTTYGSALVSVDKLLAEANSALAYYSGLHTIAEEAIQDHSGELDIWRGELTSTQGPLDLLNEAVDELVLGLGYIPPPPPLTEWQKWSRDLQTLLSDAIVLGFRGGFEDFEELADELTAGWANQLGQSVADAFSQGGFEGVSEWAQQNRGQAIIGGAATIYQASQQQSRTAGTLQGMMGGAAAGTAILPGWGTLIGAIIGGIVGYFTSGTESPRTAAYGGPEGFRITDTAGHQGYGPERRGQWAQGMNAVYNRLWQQYRGIAEMFGSPELLEAMGELPEWTSGGMMGISADELARLLSDTILPAEFFETFRSVFRTGLENLGISDAMFAGLEDMLASLPGQERLRYLSDYISTVVGMVGLVGDLGTTRVAGRGGWQQVSNLTIAAGRDPWDTFWMGFDDALNQIDVLTAGWDEMNLAMQIEQGAQVLALGETWYQNMLQYQKALIDLQEQMQAGIDSFRDTLVTRDMTDYEKSRWAVGQFQLSLSTLRGASTPDEAQAAYARAMQMLQLLEGLGGGGFRMNTEDLMRMLGDLEVAMQGTMGGFVSEVETQAQILGEAIGEVLGDLLGYGMEEGGLTRFGEALSDATEVVKGLSDPGGDLDVLGTRALETGSMLERLGHAANRLTVALSIAGDAALALAAASRGDASGLAAVRSAAATSQSVVFS